MRTRTLCMLFLALTACGDAPEPKAPVKPDLTTREKVTYNGNIGTTMRLRVHGGWVVGSYRALTFVPDAEHAWGAGG